MKQFLSKLFITIAVALGTHPAATMAVSQSEAEISRNGRLSGGIVSAATILLFGLVWLGIVAFMRLKTKKDFTYILFFTIFYVYIYKVLDYTLLRFQTLLLLQHLMPNLILNGIEADKAVNLIPLATLTLEDVKTSLLNILMMMPFGFGLPFITSLQFKKVFTWGLLFSVTVELLQLITGLMANTAFRITDVNDVIFNTLGVTIGYILFIVFTHFCRRELSKTF